MLKNKQVGRKRKAPSGKIKCLMAFDGKSDEMPDKTPDGAFGLSGLRKRAGVGRKSNAPSGMNIPVIYTKKRLRAFDGKSDETPDGAFGLSGLR